jgi:hypothetical protein
MRLWALCDLSFLCGVCVKCFRVLSILRKGNKKALFGMLAKFCTCTCVGTCLLNGMVFHTQGLILLYLSKLDHSYKVVEIWVQVYRNYLSICRLLVLFCCLRFIICDCAHNYTSYNDYFRTSFHFNTFCYKQSSMFLGLEGNKLLLCAAV